MKKLLLIGLVLAPQIGFGCICFRPQNAPLKYIIDENNKRGDNSKHLLIKAKILGRNKTVHGLPQEVNAVNIQIQEYWYQRDLNFESDTLTIFDAALCGSKFKKDSLYIIDASLDFNIYRTGCGEHLIISNLKDELHLLGKSFKVNNRFKPSIPKSQLVKQQKLGFIEISLLISIVMNILALIFIMKKKSSS